MKQHENLCAICQAPDCRLYHIARDSVRRSVWLCATHDDFVETLIRLTATREKHRGEMVKVSDLKRSRAIMAREVNLDGKGASMPKNPRSRRQRTNPSVGMA